MGRPFDNRLWGGSSFQFVMSNSAFPQRTRCEAHGLAAAPDGRCVRCRRIDDQVASRLVISRLVLGVGLAIVLLVGYKAAMAFGPIRAEQVASESSRSLPPVPSATETLTTPGQGTAWPAPRPEVTATWTAQPPASTAPLPSAGQTANDPSVAAVAAAERDRALKSAMGHVDIVIYTTSWCPACKQARSWMNENALSYSERDIEHDRDANEKLKKISGGTTIPTFDIEGQVHVGFSPSWVQSARRSVAERRLARNGF